MTLTEPHYATRCRCPPSCDSNLGGTDISADPLKAARSQESPLTRSMRLLDTRTGQFVETNTNNIEYAILSHTWDNQKGEQTFKQLRKIQKRHGTVLSQRPRAISLFSPLYSAFCRAYRRWPFSHAACSSHLTRPVRSTGDDTWTRERFSTANRHPFGSTSPGGCVLFQWPP